VSITFTIRRPIGMFIVFVNAVHVSAACQKRSQFGALLGVYTRAVGTRLGVYVCQCLIYEITVSATVVLVCIDNRKNVFDFVQRLIQVAGMCQSKELCIVRCVCLCALRIKLYKVSGKRKLISQHLHTPRASHHDPFLRLCWNSAIGSRAIVLVFRQCQILCVDPMNARLALGGQP